ncbi:MAG: hypothetical protein CSA62_08520 [Planctomycetota bacterium]|nr:MAG: hypothetical protein CSA62_08520 [Planctomycetota bacterium]
MREVLSSEALSPWQPSSGDAWDLKKAAHLGRRAAFGARREELDLMLQQGPDAAIEALFHPGSNASFEQLFAQLEGFFFDLSRRDGLQRWWCYRMLHGPGPLRERMTLFWHDHFATSIRKVGRGRYMQLQNETLRKHALGKFGDLLLAISKDPAMLIWLDNRLSSKGRPNENYARELLELFALGRDHYEEGDIKEVARAFTGWTTSSGRFVFSKNRHDAGEKTIFGKKGKWGGEDVIDLILENPHTARFVAGKIWKDLVGEWLPEDVHEDLAQGFRESSYDIAALVGRILRSRAFFSEQAHRSRIADPAEYVLGIVRRLESRPRISTVASQIAILGQALFAPPGVEGWKRGEAWLSARWCLLRIAAVASLVNLRGASGEARWDVVAYCKKHGLKVDEQIVDHFLDLFVDGEVEPATRARLLHYLNHVDRSGKAKKGEKGPDRKSPFKPDYRHIDNKVRGLVNLILSLPEAQTV